MSYKEKLLDVRWQKRRLHILEKDNWRCRACNTKDGTFHVHHLWYEKDRDPWDYPDEALITLCSRCHERAPGIDWKQSFLDLNVTEHELLYLAAQLHWRKKKYDELTKDIQEKYKTRTIDFFVMAIDLFESSDDLSEFYDSGFLQSIKEKYGDV